MENKSTLSGIILSAKDKLVYNAEDKRGRIWSVWKIEDGLAHCQACGEGYRVLGCGYEQIVPVETLIPYRRHF